jgi:nitroreductase
MMAEIGVYEAMRTLRAIRRLRPDPIADDVLHRVLEAATWAPTGGNRQPWRVIVVKERARKERLGTLYVLLIIGQAGSQKSFRRTGDKLEE